MVIGMVPNTARAESLLNNLSEAEFRLADVSVILRDPELRNAIAKDTGPFKGVTAPALVAKLTQAGLSQTDAKAYGDAVMKGQVFVAVAAPKASESVAAEMLKDASAQSIKVLS